MRLAGQVAVVTGTSRGIGRAIAVRLAREGAAVAGCSLGGGRGFLDDLPPGTRGLHIACDLRRADEVARLRDAALAELGAPALLVNNAGTVVRAPFDQLGEAAWDEVIASNLKSTFLVTHAFLPELRRRGRARIINVASIAGRQGTAELSAYCAAKHAVVGLTRALAEELRPEGIAVNAICPGSVDTDMLRIGMPGGAPHMTPDEIADVAIFLAVEAPAALTGSCIDVFG